VRSDLLSEAIKSEMIGVPSIDTLDLRTKIQDSDNYYQEIEFNVCGKIKIIPNDAT